jgi:hypothetical protein
VTKKELVRRLCAHPSSGFRRRELESQSESSLRELLDSLEFKRPQPRGDEPPELTEEDERLLDQIWASIEQRQG